MRKHSVRKFIHAVLDCLPLLVIPIFAIYSQNHEINDNTITINESYWETTPKFETSEVNNFNLINDYIYKFENNVELCDAIDYIGDLYISYYYIYDFTFDIYYEGYSEEYGLLVGFDGNNIIVSNDGDDPFIPLQHVQYIYLVTEWQYYISAFSNYQVVVTESDFIPTNTIYHENEPITYNDTDIMSQFMYVTYNAVDKYFNMNKVFNLGNIWTWVNNTLFGGQAPLSAFIVYNVIAYEFIMDIIFLVYAVFMFIIDFAENCLDNAFYKSKRGISR